MKPPPIHRFKTFSSSSSAYLAVVNAACERAPMIYPRAVSDGQFYSPPESVAGDLWEPAVFLWGHQSHRLRAFSSQRLSAGSEEDLDEERLGHRAVTPQVTGNDGG